MNVQEMGSTQILKNTGLNMEDMSEKEVTISSFLLDKVVSDYNLNEFIIDIRTKNNIVFRQNDNTFAISFDNNSTIMMQINDFVIGKIKYFPNKAIFEELYKGNMAIYVFNFLDLLDINAKWLNDTKDYINITAKSCGFKHNEREFVQFNINDVEHIKGISAGTEYDIYSNTIREIEKNFDSKLKTKNTTLNRVKKLLNAQKK